MMEILKRIHMGENHIIDLIEWGEGIGVWTVEIDREPSYEDEHMEINFNNEKDARSCFEAITLASHIS